MRYVVVFSHNFLDCCHHYSTSSQACPWQLFSTCNDQCTRLIFDAMLSGFQVRKLHHLFYEKLLLDFKITHPITPLTISLHCTAFSLVKIFPRSRRDLGAFLAAEIFISAEISPLISARFWPPRFSSWPRSRRRPKTRRDYWRDLGEMKISAAKNAPRLLARSRRDENLGGQKRAEITGEISPR